MQLYTIIHITSSIYLVTVFIHQPR